MNPEYLLNAMGLLDDDLIQEAEQYSRPRPKVNYNAWLSLASCLVLVITLGYGVNLLLRGGGSSGNSAEPSGGGQADTPASSSPIECLPGATAGGESNGFGAPSGEEYNGEGLPQPPGAGCDEANAADEIFGMEEGRCPAIMVDGTLSWYTSAIVTACPDEGDIRYSSSYVDGDPEEDGQVNFPKEGVRYVVLEEGKVGVNWDNSCQWKVFVPIPPEEQ